MLKYLKQVYHDISFKDISHWENTYGFYSYNHSKPKKSKPVNTFPDILVPTILPIPQVHKTNRSHHISLGCQYTVFGIDQNPLICDE